MITTYTGQNQQSNFTVLVCHGSMQTKFDQFHPLVQFYQSFCKTVYSIELPGHGSQRQYDDVSTLTVQEILDLLYNAIDTTCPRENMFITSYSVSGMLFMKLWERLYNRNNDLKGIFIGTAIKFKPETVPMIKRFFSEETYIKLGWENIMIRQHGPNWKNTIRMTNHWFQEDSAILPTQHEIGFLIQQNDLRNIFFILGKKDQPFKKEDITGVHQFNLYEIEGDHFSYFVIKKSWPIVKELLTKILQEWFILDKE